MAVFLSNILGKRKWNALPDSAYRHIISHMRDDYERTGPPDQYGQPYFIEENGDDLTDPVAARLYRMMCFAQRLQRLAQVSGKWDIAVNEHPFWGELSQMISGKRSPDDLKSGSLRNKDLAHSFCWICALDQTHRDVSSPGAAGAMGPDSTPMQRYQQFVNLGWVPVCTYHNADICQCCCEPSYSDGPDNGLAITDDIDVYGAQHLEICARCRRHAVEETLSNGYIHFREADVAEDHVLRGVGTAEEAGKALDEARWLYNSQDFQLLISKLDQERGWKAHKRSSDFRDRSKGRAQRGVGWVNSRGFSKEQTNAGLGVFVRQQVECCVRQGIWVAPVADDTLVQQHPASSSDFFTSVPVTFLSQPSKPAIQTWLLNMPWANAPPTLMRRFRNAFNEELRYFLVQPLRNIELMLIDRNGGNHKAASDQAELMEQEELLGWLRDPRTYVKGWWREASTEYLASVTTEALGHRVTGNKRPHANDDEVEDGPLHKQRKLDNPPSADIPTLEGVVCPATITDRRFELPKAMPSQADIAKYRTLPQKASCLKWIPSTQQKLSSAVIGIIAASWLETTEDLRRCRCGVCLRQARKAQEEDDRRKAEEAAKREKERKLAELKLLMTTRVETQSNRKENPRIEEHSLLEHDYLDPLNHLDNNTEDELDGLGLIQR